MKFVFNLFLVFQTAWAQSPHVEIVFAPRYLSSASAELREVLERLASLRSPAYEITTIELHRPILGGDESLLAEVRKRVFAKSVDDRLNLQLVITGHGSSVAIHSEKCEPVQYETFVTAWHALMAEFVSRGYRPENLSFDLILRFCYSGNLRDLMGSSFPFDTLIINSAQTDQISNAPVMANLFTRVLPAYVAAMEFDSKIFESYGEQELLYLLLNHIYRIDLETGEGHHNEKLPPPEIEWWPASTRDKQINLSSLAKHLFEVYAFALHNPQTHQQFTRTLRYVLNEYYDGALSSAVRLRADEFSSPNRNLLRHLYFHSHIDREISAVELTQHFDTMLKFSSPAIRDAATYDLLMLGDMVADADDLLAKLAKVELAQETIDLSRLRLNLEYLQEYKTPVAEATCQLLLDVIRSESKQAMGNDTNGF